MENLNNHWKLTPAMMAEHLTRGRFQRFGHIEFISDEIAKAVAAGNARIMISCPPRHGKSWLSSKWTPTWFLDRYPHKSVILASYEAGFAASWGREVRNNVLEHAEHLNVKVAADSSAIQSWKTTDGGGMTTAGVGGPVTGKGGDLIIVDDIVKNSEEADSPTYRKKVKDWWSTTLRTRAEPGASIIILMTRWHPDDLCGWLTSEANESEFGDKWTVINLPALAEENDAMGRAPGEALCPERYDTAALRALQQSVGARSWTALYQGRPVAEGGNLINPEWWRYWSTLPPKIDEFIISCDLAFTGKTTSDFVVMQVWAKAGAYKFLIDQFRGQWGFTKTVELFKVLCQKHPHARRKLVENKANGPALEDQLKKLIPGIILVEPRGDKVARVNAVTPTIEAGNVFLPSPSRTPWLEEFIVECAEFPTAPHDDQVDCLSQALKYFDTRKALPAPTSGHGGYANEKSMVV